jgi:hypothetical protein
MISVKPYRWMLLGILVAGLLLRLSGLYWGHAYARFMNGDSLVAIEQAMKFKRGDEAAQYLGQPIFNSQSNLPGPLWTIVCAGAVHLGGSPSAAPLPLMLFNLAAVLITARLASEVFGRVYGIWAALFAATLPWTVFYSLGLYNPVVMAVVGGLLYLVLWRVFTWERSAFSFWIAPIMLGSLQIHMSVMMLLPAVVILFVISPRRVNWPLMFAGILAGLLFYIPYVSGELANDWRNTLGMISGERAFKISALKIITAPVNMLGGVIGRMFHDTETYFAFADKAFMGRYLLLLLTLISGVMGLFYFYAAVRETFTVFRKSRGESRPFVETDPGIAFMSVLIFVSLLGSLFSGRGFHSRYTIVLFPLLMMCPAIFIVRWLPALTMRWRRWAMFGIGASFIFHLYLVPAFYAYQGEWIRNSPYPVCSHRQLEEIYDAMRAVTPAGYRIGVDTSRFLREGTPDRWDSSAAGFIPIMCSIQDYYLGLSPADPAKIFRLVSTRRNQVEADKAVYNANGIALVPNF